MKRLALLLLLWTHAALAEHLVLRGATVAGASVADVEIDDGRIVAVGAHLPAPGARRIDLRGKWLAPAFIDSHVHLAYYPVAAALAAAGVAGAVDLGAPIAFLAASHAPLRVIAAGPMLTVPGGYPLNAWGHDGYGLECADAAAASAAVDRLHAAGAGVIKLALTDGWPLHDDAIAAATARAHALGLKVAAHALEDWNARRAARGGVDILAHTPVEPLADVTVAAWRGRAVITTLSAFGGTPSAVENLVKLRAAGVTVLYGTDLGNDRTVGIDGDELALMAIAGMDGAAILAAGTSVPAAFWHFDDLGAIAVGKAASILVLDADPLRTPGTLAHPVMVINDGRMRH